MSESFEIRAAIEADMPDIAAINNWYILNTVITFHEEAQELSTFTESYRDIVGRGLPYLVAVSRSRDDPHGARKVLGYVSAGVYRPRFAYRYTVEISLFCDPKYQGQGIGSALLRRLIEELRKGEVKQIIAVMSVDEAGPRKGLKLKSFYEGLGFEQAGYFKRVGWKFGRWVDTIHLQLSL